jgi:hypothetical protein
MEPLVPTEQKVVWVPHPVWMFWKKKSLPPARDGNLDLTPCSPITIQTALLLARFEVLKAVSVKSKVFWDVWTG